MFAPWQIRRLHDVGGTEIDALAALLVDCVAEGASVSFLASLSPEKAAAFWQGVARGVAAGTRALLIAEDDKGLCGTVQLVLETPENQPHRAELVKMIVDRRMRKQGLGAALMKAAEATALDCGKTLLVLDTVTGSAASRLYERLGWVRVGEIPGYAFDPAGQLCGTTLYYRDLARPAVTPARTGNAFHDS